MACIAVSPPPHTLSQSDLTLEAPLREEMWAIVEEAPKWEPHQGPGDPETSLQVPVLGGGGEVGGR